MKSWVWQVLTFVICFIIVSVLHLPLWAFLLIGAPAMLMGLTYYSFSYSFRSSLQPEQIPAKGYESRVETLNLDYYRLANLQFHLIDYFYLKTIPDAVIYIYRHQTEPVYFCVYHYGSKISYELISYFDNDVTLTTTASVNAAMSPRPIGELIQVFEDRPLEYLMPEHLKGVNYLKYFGYSPTIFPDDRYRGKFMEEVFKSVKKIKSYALWPARMVYWTVTKRGRIHRQSIIEQLNNGIAQIPQKQLYPS
jgi:hypothetical protein